MTYHRPLVTICGADVGKGDWVAITFVHPDGPVLAHIGQIVSWDAEPEESGNVTISTDQDPLRVPFDEIESCGLADGPYHPE